ncbi:MAG: glycosyltransferase family 4 protein, partial [bacterium]
ENPQEDSLKAALRTSQRSNLKVEHPTKYQTAPLLLAVGRLVEKKGFPYLIEACKQLREQGIQFRCEIAGDGPMHAQLEKQVWQSGLDDAIVLHGALPPEEIKKFYAQASLFVLPSFITKSGDRDGIPNVILEAMAMALPVVATRVSGIPEAIVHEETGLLVPEKDADALAQAIINLLSNPARRQQLGNAGRERVTHKFTLEANVKQKMELMLG